MSVSHCSFDLHFCSNTGTSFCWDLFMCLLTICILVFLKKYLLKCFGWFIWLFDFFILEQENYIIWIKVSYHIYDLHTYFFLLHGLWFTFSTVSFEGQNFLILMKYIIYPFYSVTSAFGFVSEKPLLNWQSQIYSYALLELYSSIILRSMIWVDFCVWYEDGRTLSLLPVTIQLCHTTGWKTILPTTEFSWHTLNWQ